MPTSPRAALTAIAVLAFAVACGNPEASPAPPPSSPASPPPAASSSAPPASTSSSVPSSTASSTPAVPSGKVVVIDPGHNGGNSSHTAEINKQVPAGRGQMKPCNTTGTSTNAGYTEHAFTWDVANKVRDELAAKGVKVIMTRQNDSGVGPCVDARAAAGNQAKADAVVSIHADGSESAGAHGFHVAYSSPALNTAQGAPSTKLTQGLRDALKAAGFATSTYIGKDGLSPRADLGGLNLSERPAALVECGNMRNAAEAAVLSSSDGRQRYADAITKAILTYLG